jgi:putative membrane protein
MMTGFDRGWGLLGMALVLVLFWGGLVVLAVLLVRALFPRRQQRPPGPSGREPTAREILDQRYARGEITREQFDQMKRDLA